jgi:hypothetical protein
MDEIKDPQHMTGHFFSPEGTRMEASYIRYAHQNGLWAYYKLPGSERTCECREARPYYVGERVV